MSVANTIVRVCVVSAVTRMPFKRVESTFRFRPSVSKTNAGSICILPANPPVLTTREGHLPTGRSHGLSHIRQSHDNPYPWAFFPDRGGERERHPLAGRTPATWERDSSERRHKFSPLPPVRLLATLADTRTSTELARHHWGCGYFIKAAWRWNSRARCVSPVAAPAKQGTLSKPAWCKAHTVKCGERLWVQSPRLASISTQLYLLGLPQNQGQPDRDHPPDDPKMRNVIVSKMVDGYVLAVYRETKTVFQVGVFHPDIRWKQVISDLGVE